MANTSRRILVTGASGFIGRLLIADLVQAGYLVRATRRRGAVPDIEDAPVVDLTTDVDWQPLLRDVDVVIHLAGLAHVASSTPRSTFDQINSIGTQKLATAAKAAGVSQFIFISTVRAQVAASAAHVVRESDAPQPTDHYGRSKLAGEIAIRKSGVPATILRPVGVYGPNPKGNILTVVRLANSSMPLPVRGMNVRRSLLGIDNLISAILFVLNNPATVGETYLIADQDPVTLPELFAFMRRALSRRPMVFYLPPNVLRLLLAIIRRQHLWQRIGENLVVDTGKLRSLGWRPPVDTYTGILAMLRGQRARPQSGN